MGIFISGCGFFYFASIAAVDTVYLLIALGMCIIAVGISFTMSSATNSIMGSIPLAEAGIGSAMNDTTRQVGGALGVAIIGTVMNSRYLRAVNAIQWPPATPPQVLAAVRNSIQGAHVAAANIPNRQLSQFIIDKSNRAFVTGMTHGMIVTSIIMITASILTFSILPARVRSYEEDLELNTWQATKTRIDLWEVESIPYIKAYPCSR